MRVLATLLLTALAVTATAAGRDPYRYFFDESFGDYSEELAIAREEGKRGVVVFFEMEECPFCERMRREVLNREDVQKFFRERFRLLTLDIEGDVEVVDFDGTPMTEKAMAERYRVRATPVIGFFDLDGRMVVRYTGATSSAEEFLWLGEYVADGHYRKMPFARYKRIKKRERRAD